MSILNRNSYLVSKAMKNFMAASMLTMIITQMNTTVDGMMVGNLIGSNAFSAINLYVPISMTIIGVSALLFLGAMLLVSKYIGERNYQKLGETLATSVIAILTCAIVLVGIAIFFIEPLVDFLCKNEELKHYLLPYARINIACGGIMMLSLFCNNATSYSGEPRLVTRSILIMSVTNILLDYTFIKWLQMGIAGAAYATVVSLLLNIAILSRFLLREYKEVFSNLFKLISLHAFEENLKQGIPMSIGNFITMSLFLVLNTTILNVQGADGMFVWSVLINLLSLGMMLVMGIGSAVMSIGSFLMGQKDYAGLRFLINKACIWVICCLLGIVVFVECFPGLVNGLFGADSMGLIAFANHTIRICVWIIPAVLFCIFMNSFYRMLGYTLLSTIVTLFYPIVFIPSLFLWMKLAGEASIWYAFPQAGAVIILLLLLVSEMYRWKKPNLSHILLVSDTKLDCCHDVSVRADTDSLKQSLKPLTCYLKELDIEETLVNRINLCLEEMMLNIVNYSGRNMKDHWFDVHIVLAEGKLTASLKDDGIPFDPVHVSEEKRGIGLTLLHGLCEDIEYKYMYGQNMTYMSWNIK